MKTLILIRHAKSRWNDPGSSDFDRSLNHRGERDVPIMGNRLRSRLKASALDLDAFLCSSACRAMQTANLLAKALKFPETSIDWHKSLYLASPSSMLDIIRSTSDNTATIALLAHNPGITQLAEMLSGRAFCNVPTCGIITLQWPVRHWMEIDNRAALIDFDYPKLRSHLQ